MLKNIMADSDVEDAFPLPYEPKDWIGCGRKLPKKVQDIPSALSNYFTPLRAIPDDTKQHFYPPKSLSVDQFLEFTLPASTSGFGTALARCLHPGKLECHCFHLFLHCFVLSFPPLLAVSHLLDIPCLPDLKLR